MTKDRKDFTFRKVETLMASEGRRFDVRAVPVGCVDSNRLRPTPSLLRNSVRLPRRSEHATKNRRCEQGAFAQRACFLGNLPVGIGPNDGNQGHPIGCLASGKNVLDCRNREFFMVQVAVFHVSSPGNLAGGSV